MKKISVIVPVFNAGRFLEKCIDSILIQDYPVHQVILINDGSTDDSKSICEKLAQKDSRVVLVNKKNEGVSKARNDGLERATGELISFIDADDCLEQGMYSYLVNLLEKHEADISHCGYKRMNENDEILNECFGTGETLVQTAADAVDYMLKGLRFSGGLWNKLFKFSIIRNIRFEESLKNNEDILFNALVFQNANKIVFGDETKYLYYEHGTSACNVLPDEKKAEDSLRACEILVQNSKGEKMKRVAQRHLFLNRLSRYRSDVLNKKRNANAKRWLQESYCKELDLTATEKLNYNFLMCFPIVYRMVYLVYCRVFRKAKWDPKQ